MYGLIAEYLLSFFQFSYKLLTKFHNRSTIPTVLFRTHAGTASGKEEPDGLMSSRDRGRAARLPCHPKRTRALCTYTYG